jgi:hypothetical protein
MLDPFKFVPGNVQRYEGCDGSRMETLVVTLEPAGNDNNESSEQDFEDFGNRIGMAIQRPSQRFEKGQLQASPEGKTYPN